MNISLSAPDITEKEINLVREVLKGNILSIGPKIDAFEKEFATFMGVQHAVAVNSGTSGLHLLVKGLDLKPGDEVITTPFSFVASSNCLLYEGVRPVFADIDENTLNIDIKLIEDKINSKTKAILPVHVFGHPVPMDKIKTIAQKYNLKIIEDSCEAIGAEYKGQKVGTFGDGGVFAFYPNKQMTTGEGGMIVTNNDDLAAACVSMRNQGRNAGTAWLSHDRLGYNYRLDEMSAALGLGQLQRIGEILAKRNWVATMYYEKLKEIKEVTLPRCFYNSTDITVSWFVFVIRLDSAIDRNRVIEYLGKSGVQSKPYFEPIHTQPFYREQFGYKPGDFPITEKVAASTIAIPFFNNLTEEQIDYVVDTLKKAIKHCKH